MNTPIMPKKLKKTLTILGAPYCSSFEHVGWEKQKNFRTWPLEVRMTNIIYKINCFV